MKNMCFLGNSFFKIKIAATELLINKIFRQKFITLKTWGIGVNYCWNYLLLYICIIYIYIYIYIYILVSLLY